AYAPLAASRLRTLSISSRRASWARSFHYKNLVQPCPGIRNCPGSFVKAAGIACPSGGAGAAPLSPSPVGGGGGAGGIGSGGSVEKSGSGGRLGALGACCA